MDRKYIYLIVGIVAAVVTISGIAGGLAIAGSKQKNDMRMTLILLSFTPAKMEVEIQYDTTWMGNWAIGSDGGSESDGAGIYTHTGKGTIAMASYAITDGGGGSLTIRIYVNEKLKCTKSATSFGETITCTAESPYRILFFLALLI